LCRRRLPRAARRVATGTTTMTRLREATRDDDGMPPADSSELPANLTDIVSIWFGITRVGECLILRAADKGP
jgi:hypothetical protein